PAASCAPKRTTIRSSKRCFFSADGKTLVGLGQMLQMWDLASGKNLLDEGGHRLAVNGLVFLGDGRLATRGLDNTLRCWEVSTGGEVDKVTSQPVGNAALGPTADRLGVVFATSTYGVNQWVPGQPAQRHPFSLVGPGTTQAEFSDDGRFLTSVR